MARGFFSRYGMRRAIAIRDPAYFRLGRFSTRNTGKTVRKLNAAVAVAHGQVSRTREKVCDSY
jgi:hypothetical protein